MWNEFTAVLERDGRWYIALLPGDSWREWTGTGQSGRVELKGRNINVSPELRLA